VKRWALLLQLIAELSDSLGPSLLISPLHLLTFLNSLLQREETETLQLSLALLLALLESGGQGKPIAKLERGEELLLFDLLPLLDKLENREEEEIRVCAGNCHITFFLFDLFFAVFSPEIAERSAQDERSC
jgi:hypothetical protein